MAHVDTEPIREAYHDVRNDATETTWAVFGYDGKNIGHTASGTDYNEFLGFCQADERFYGFVRVEVGDEMSRRAKFAFVTFIGDNVPPLKKAKVSTDKAFIKEICSNFAKEFLVSESRELAFSTVVATIEKAGGANYGTGK